MLEQVLDYIHNYFYTGSTLRGTFTISGGTLALPDLLNDQYYRITGSVFNDGVHRNPASELIDETFYGTIRPMAVPRTLMDVVTDIEAWVEQYGTVMNSPYQSETVIGVYSYIKSSAGINNGGDQQSDWQYVFRKRLDPWRKVG